MCMVRCSRGLVFDRIARAVLVTAALIACANPAPRNAAPGGFPARERNCAFELLGAIPGSDYVEIARIALAGDTNFGWGKYRDTRAAANALREMVCEIGGDAVKTEVDGRGAVVSAIVFHRVQQCQPPCADGETCGNDRRCRANQ